MIEIMITEEQQVWLRTFLMGRHAAIAKIIASTRAPQPEKEAVDLIAALCGGSQVMGDKQEEKNEEEEAIKLAASAGEPLIPASGEPPTGYTLPPPLPPTPAEPDQDPLPLGVIYKGSNWYSMPDGTNVLGRAKALETYEERFAEQRDPVTQESPEHPGNMPDLLEGLGKSPVPNNPVPGESTGRQGVQTSKSMKEAATKG